MKRFLLQSFKDRGVNVYVETEVAAIEKDGTVMAAQKGRPAEALGPFDFVVTAVGMRPAGELYDSLASSDVELVCIGDAKKPGNALDAIEDGYLAALRI